jgi:hypothetical protein
VQLPEIGDVDAHAGVLHPGQHPDQGVLDGGVQLGHAVGGQLGRDRLDELVHGERLAPGDGRRLGGRAVEVELPLGRRLVGGEGEARVALDEVAELVARLRRVEQVGGDGRVERQPGEVDQWVVGQQGAHQRLCVVGPHRGGAEGVGDGRVVEVVGRDPRDRRCIGVGDDGQAEQRGAPRLPLPGRGEVDGRQRRQRRR